jgi:hypothetical protein
MAPKREPRLRTTIPPNTKGLWIDHLVIHCEDSDQFAPVERLTLWNVKMPIGFLAKLKNLWWLDIRGGSATDLEVAKGAVKLKFLAVNQVRGMQDLAVISSMVNLQYLLLYGLPKVAQLPPLSALTELRHASLGQMRGLLSLHGLLQAPQLKELLFMKKIGVLDADVDEITKHPTISQFSWYGEDIPVKTWKPIVEKIGLPPVPLHYPEEWFGIDHTLPGGVYLSGGKVK